jgi:Tfp pilus assembly protein PilV
MKKTFLTKKYTGFTIVETLITLLAITIMIAGPLTFMYRSYNYSELVNSKVISVGLAQEGLELATSLRNVDLNTFITTATTCSSGCMADWDGQSAQPTFTTCTDEGCKLYKNNSSDGNLYRATGDTETGQYRSVKFTPAGTTGYLLESTAWSYVNGNKIESKLTKMIFNLNIK